MAHIFRYARKGVIQPQCLKLDFESEPTRKIHAAWIYVPKLQGIFPVWETPFHISRSPFDQCQDSNSAPLRSSPRFLGERQEAT